MDPSSVIETGTFETLESEIPDRLRNLIEEHQPSIRHIVVQQKKDGQWRTLRERIRGVAGLDLDHVCQTVVQAVQRHAEGSESDRIYRAKLVISAEDGTLFPRFAQIKARMGADGEVEVQDSSENEERGHVALLRDVMEYNRQIQKEDMEQKKELLKDMQEQARLNMQQQADNARAFAELIAQNIGAGEAMQSVMVGAASMFTTGMELHTAHASQNAEVQIAQMGYDAEAAKWGGALSILEKVAKPLGGQIAASFGLKTKKGKVTQKKPTAVAGESGSDETALAVVDGDAKPKVKVVIPPQGWEKGMANKTANFLAKLDDRRRAALAKNLGTEVVASFESAAKNDEEASTYLPVIRAGIEQRLQDHEDEQKVLMFRLEGALEEELFIEFLDLLPPETEQPDS